ncbi:tetratricopeptide repeat protein [uncultured Methanobrevibacter sp.]|uniref:tetratricopeptide repeat protein n=1 Tax=uncultured Methanobrevibacter sp. TaxID=253161 RepID=UPI0025D5EF39|nr:hypothetical protein [uncultured Methanobrevibacter sp.]
MTFLNVPDNHILEKTEGKITYDFDLTIFTHDDNVRFSNGDISTSWMSSDDGFISRIQFEKLNPDFRKEHLTKEIEFKNILDEAKRFLENGKYAKAIEKFDDVIYYDLNYCEAIFYKSKALFGQKHFVKSLRHYKRAVKCNPALKDMEYYKMLLKKSSEERDNFPKIKQNIYAGDEYFAKQDYVKALDCYSRALKNPSKFKDKILYKLLNKKATALLKLNHFHDSGKCFLKSIDVFENDYAYFGLAVSLQKTKGPNQKIKEALDNAIKINQKQLLKKAMILKDIGELEDSLKCIDEFLAIHYCVDDDYQKALNLKLSVLNNPLRDNCEIKN